MNLETIVINESAGRVNRSNIKLSVIFSFYNEEAVLAELIRRTNSVLLGLVGEKKISDYEVIFINDASTDKSSEIIKEHAERYGKIILVEMSRNFGNSECVFAGFKIATGDAVVYLDADLQDPPELIGDMVDAWCREDDIEVVYTTRNKRAGEHPLKLMLTKFGYRLVNLVSDINIPLDSGDYKLVSRRALNHLLLLNEQVPYTRGLISWVGFKQKQIFYDREPRFDGREQTKFPVLSRRVISGYLDRALISFSDVPLKLILFFGVILSLASFLYLIIVIVQKIMGLHEPGWPSLMFAVLMLGGFQLSVLGVMGLYIGGIYKQVKNRPLSIIDKISAPKNLIEGLDLKKIKI